MAARSDGGWESDGVTVRSKVYITKNNIPFVLVSKAELDKIDQIVEQNSHLTEELNEARKNLEQMKVEIEEKQGQCLEAQEELSSTSAELARMRDAAAAQGGVASLSEVEEVMQKHLELHLKEIGELFPRHFCAQETERMPTLPVFKREDGSAASSPKGNEEEASVGAGGQPVGPPARKAPPPPPPKAAPMPPKVCSHHQCARTMEIDPAGNAKVKNAVNKTRNQMESFAKEGYAMSSDDEYQTQVY